ncbi:MAG: hypothetical protein Q7V57_05290 [Actinomycetota bacterium]|nr:hypothetical protein [Actinomycetota bacterium]
MYRTVLLSLHIASVAAWLGCNFTQLFLGPSFARRGGDAAMAWFEASARLARRYYNAAGTVLGVTGVLLVREVGYEWSAGFVAVGITVVVIGALLGVLVFAPGGDRLAVAQREGDTGRVKALATRYTFAAAVDTTLVLTAVLAMVHRWRA